MHQLFYYFFLLLFIIQHLQEVENLITGTVQITTFVLAN